jgi:superfamily I DNA/RNA helicase
MVNLNELNDRQRKAAESIQGPLLILAGAGSGKTRTITYRMGHMISNKHINPKSILAVTFTNKAAKEMQERISQLIGKSQIRGLTVSTFHALCVKILRKEIHHLGYKKSFSIYDTSDQMSILREALKNYRADKKFDRKSILAKIGFLKNHGVSAEQFVGSTHFNPEDEYDIVSEYCYHYYQEKLHLFNVIDFDDILSLTVKLFKNYPEVAQKYSRKFQYIMIDEYQDTNPLQFDLVLALTSTHDNLCVVGDDDQSIYSFRGADISNILNFEEHFKGAHVVKLEQNYRSTGTILKLANEVISCNSERKDKKMWSDIKSDKRPYLWLMADSDHEAAVVIDDIAKKLQSGFDLSEVAVLYRSNTQIPPFEEQLRLAQIPYQIIGGQKFYEKKEIKDLIAYLTLIHNPFDETALRRIINTPHRGIGTVTLKKFIQQSADEKLTLFTTLRNNRDIHPPTAKFLDLFSELKNDFETLPIDDALEKCVKRLDFNNWIKAHYESPKLASVKLNDVQQFIQAATRFLKYTQNKGKLKDFLERLLLQDSQDNKDEDKKEVKNQVTLMTLHSSKGLEFDCVYLIGMEEELLPHKRTISLNQDISEERRLAYVGITRARKDLVMTCCKQRKLFGKDSPRLKSRFLDDMKDYFTEQDRTTFGHLSEEETKQYKKSFFGGLIDQLDQT